MTREALETSWRETTSWAGLTEADTTAVFLDLSRRYSEAGRAYHTLDHIAGLLDMVSRFQSEMQDETAIHMAVWFHDAVYDTRRADNEEQSAAYMTALLSPAGAAPALLSSVERLILATKTHLTSPTDIDCQLLMDADLAVFGSCASDYDHYAQAIRQEYAWVSQDDYGLGRRKVLESFLSRERLYQRPSLFDQFEKMARTNLRREIERLAALQTS